eukprot:CAMPEP_0175410652 /NCGR_PEP_ID=MMETSP0095-20121207/41723_1 /TAXON_ID=311494 /ORGANISM="Alexandrium monilatum, Strain CCMP3105" /LENGTH=281 /DNA_ID=CAMNT_0016709617 /DNA_START=42 /DNA_END=883 /DNA_ORIENTATION=-
MHDEAAQQQQREEEEEEEGLRLREKVEELLRQARLILHGDAPSKPSPRPAIAKRAEREQELERALEKADWYRQEIKRLQKELDARGAARGGGSALGDPQERDPMELQNLLAEKRKDLQQLKRSGEGLDRIAEAQRRAEAAQNSMTPENAERLQRAKDEVENKRRLNVKLFSERQKLASACKKAEAQVRAAEAELRSKAAELRPPPRAAGVAGGNARDAAAKDAVTEPQVLKQLQRDVDILKEAVRQDERKFRTSERSDEQQSEAASSSIRGLEEAIAEREA